MRFLALIGGGEHARVVAEAAGLSGWTIAGVIDAAPVTGFSGHLGVDADLPRLQRDRPELRFIIAVGHLGRRHALALRWTDLPWAIVIHPAATVSAGAHLGPGVFVGAQAVVQTATVVGDHSIINTAAVVEHDAVLGRSTHLAPGAIVGGGARLGDETSIGLNAGVRDHITIGSRVTVGMGAAVVKDVADGMTVMGVPARIARKGLP